MSCQSQVNHHEGLTIAVTLIKDIVLTIPLRSCYSVKVTLGTTSWVWRKNHSWQGQGTR